MVRKDKIEIKEGLRGGKGSIEFHHILEEKELLGHGRLFAKLVIKPNSSIGTHQHVKETEPYYILKGEGVFVDNDGTRTKVGPGDVCLIEVGQSHSIENNTQEDLELIALIYFEENK